MLIDRDDVDVGVGVALDRNDAKVSRQVGECFDDGVDRSDDDHALDALVDQSAMACRTAGSIGRAQTCHGDEVVGLKGGLLDAVQRRGRAVQRAVEGDDAERLRLDR